MIPSAIEAESRGGSNAGMLRLALAAWSAEVTHPPKTQDAAGRESGGGLGIPTATSGFN
jgi:hypothetical protein